MNTLVKQTAVFRTVGLTLLRAASSIVRTTGSYFALAERVSDSIVGIDSALDQTSLHTASIGYFITHDHARNNGCVASW